MTKAADVLKSLEELGKKQYLPSIGPVKGKIVVDIIKKYQPKNILEIGSLYGYSAILMASVLPDVGRVVAIEIDKKNADIAKKNIKDAGFLNKIDLLIGNALELIPRLDYKFDLLFLDAAKNEYLQYLNLAEEKNLIKKNAIIIADNVGIFKNEMLDYLEYIRNSGIYKSETIETTLEFAKDRDAIEVSVRVV
ncbi:MAG: CmcI family methyltransferase [Candidatus Nitrosocosmicus sp.]